MALTIVGFPRAKLDAMLMLTRIAATPFDTSEQALQPSLKLCLSRFIKRGRGSCACCNPYTDLLKEFLMTGWRTNAKHSRWS
jgi:hypothetical protein